MVTFIMLIRKRAELSRDEFIDYYENKHMAVIGRLFGGAMPASARYFYAAADDTMLRRLAGGRGDNTLENIAAITELSFDTAADAEAMIERMLDPEVLATVLADESNFIAPDGITMFMAADRETPDQS